MLGVSETYLGAFAVELGHGAERLALLATLPLALGAVAQLMGMAFLLPATTTLCTVVVTALVLTATGLRRLDAMPPPDAALDPVGRPAPTGPA